MKYYYSVYNLDKERVTHRVFLDGTTVYKYSVDGELKETYYATTTKELVDDDEVFRSVNELGEDKERYYFQANPPCLHKYVDGKKKATDYIGDKQCVLLLVDKDVQEKIQQLPYKVTYYSNKPYGRIVGILEKEWQGRKVANNY